MESWRLVWRDGFAKLLPTAGLLRLLERLNSDSPLLTQGSTTTPPPLMCFEGWPVEAADAIATAAVGEWDGATVGECEEAFARACFDCDQTLGEPAACRWFLNWFDDTPRDEMRRELGLEVRRELWNRGEQRRVQLDPLLEAARIADPTDTELLRAISDYYRDHGDDYSADMTLATIAVAEGTDK